MPVTGTPEEQGSESSVPSSTNSGGTTVKQILKVRGLPFLLQPQGGAELLICSMETCI